MANQSTFVEQTEASTYGRRSRTRCGTFSTRRRASSKCGAPLPMPGPSACRSSRRTSCTRSTRSHSRPHSNAGTSIGDGAHTSSTQRGSTPTVTRWAHLNVLGCIFFVELLHRSADFWNMTTHLRDQKSRRVTHSWLPGSRKEWFSSLTSEVAWNLWLPLEQYTQLFLWIAISCSCSGQFVSRSLLCVAHFTILTGPRRCWKHHRWHIFRASMFCARCVSSDCYWTTADLYGCNPVGRKREVPWGVTEESALFNLVCLHTLVSYHLLGHIHKVSWKFLHTPFPLPTFELLWFVMMLGQAIFEIPSTFLAIKK